MKECHQSNNLRRSASCSGGCQSAQNGGMVQLNRSAVFLFRSKHQCTTAGLARMEGIKQQVATWAPAGVCACPGCEMQHQYTLCLESCGMLVLGCKFCTRCLLASIISTLATLTENRFQRSSNHLQPEFPIQLYAVNAYNMNGYRAQGRQWPIGTGTVHTFWLSATLNP